MALAAYGEPLTRENKTYETRNQDKTFVTFINAGDKVYYQPIGKGNQLYLLRVA